MVHRQDLRANRAMGILRPYVGKIIPVRIHLGHSHGKYHNMLYVGQEDEDRWSWARFINSREVSLEGNVTFNGIYSHLCDIEERDDGMFTICNNNFKEGQFYSVICKDSKKVEKLWEKRDIGVLAE